MKNTLEQVPEKILNKDEVLEVVSRFAENFTLVRELSDEQGLYLLEVKIEGKELGETIQYEYMRKGRFSDNKFQASETAIYMMYYQNEVPVNGDKVAVYHSEIGEWEVLK